MYHRKILGCVAALVGACLLLAPLSVKAQDAKEPPAPDPLGAYAQLASAGQNGFELFTTAPSNKAFAISPKGAWGVAYGVDDMDAAQDQALKECQALAKEDEGECIVFAVNQYVLMPDGKGGTTLVEQNIWRHKAGVFRPQPEVLYAVPYLGDIGQEAFETYLAADPPKAFALSREGHWAWRAGMNDLGQALNEALNACQKPGIPCTIYAVNQRVTADLQP